MVIGLFLYTANRFFLKFTESPEMLTSWGAN